DAPFLPLPQSSPARAGTGIFFGQVPPPRAGLENPQNAFEHAPVLRPRPTTTAFLGQKRFHPGPLLVRQECFLHPQFFTKSFAKYQYKITYSFGLMKPLLVISDPFSTRSLRATLAACYDTQNMSIPLTDTFSTIPS